MTLEEKNLIMALHIFSANGDTVNLEKTIKAVHEKCPRLSWMVDPYRKKERPSKTNTGRPCTLVDKT